jgi:hypothetical protein
MLYHKRPVDLETAGLANLLQPANHESVGSYLNLYFFKMLTLTISQTDQEASEGLFLFNPTWIHLDESEIKEKLEKGEKLFKVKVE